jgi:hypothetical protein
MIRRATATALLLACLGTPAFADGQSEALLRGFLQRIDATADWSASAASIRSEGSDTVAEGVTFARKDPNVSIGVKEIRVTGLAERPDGGITAESIGVKDGSVASEMTAPPNTPVSFEYKVPTASVKNLSFPGVAEISFDPHHMMTFAGQIYSLWAKAEFTDFSVPELSGSAHQTVPGSEPAKTIVTTFDCRNLASSGMRDGVVADTTGGPISFAITNPDQETVKFEVKSVDGQRMDMGALAHVFDQREYRDGRGDGVWRPLFSKISYSGFTGSGPEGVTFGLKEVAIENVDGRQPEKPFTDDFDKLMDPAWASSATPEDILDIVLNMYSAWRVGTMRMDGLSIEAPSESASFSLGGITVSGLSNEGIDSFILKSLSGKSPEGFGSLDSFEFAGFRFPDVATLMKFAALENDAPPEKHEEVMRATFAALPRLAHFAVTGVRAGMSEAESVSMKSLSLDFKDWNDIFAQSTEMKIDDVEVPRSLANLEPQAEQMLDQLGYDKLIYSMSLSDRWTADAGTDDATWTFSMKDAANIEVSYSLIGVTVDWMLKATATAGRTEGSEAALMAMLNDIRLKSAALKVTDRSLLDRGFGVAAKMQNLNIEGSAYREQMRGALPFLLSAAVPPEITKLLSAPLQEFLAGGQTLVAEIAPAEPIPLPELAQAKETDPALLAQQLGLKLRSESPPQ